MNKSRAKIITVTSSKGGVGKTILLLNLSGIYEKLEKRVLILDFDFSGGAVALNLNLQVEKTIFQLADDIRNHRASEYKNYIEHYSKYIDVISCPRDPRQVSKIDIKDFTLFFDEVKRMYDVILIDTTHGLNVDNIYTLDLSDRILHVISNDLMDLKNTKNFINVINDIEYKNVRIVLNESFNNDLDYFNIFEMKNIIGNNIDYTVSSNFYVKKITKYLLEGKILTLSNVYKNKKDMNKLIHMAVDLLK